MLRFSVLLVVFVASLLGTWMLFKLGGSKSQPDARRYRVEIQSTASSRLALSVRYRQGHMHWRRYLLNH
jgi:hypothetical protein